MPGAVYTRTKLQGLEAIAQSLFADFKLAGLTQVMPTLGANFTPAAGKGKFIFDSSAAVNPLHATQPWRLMLDLDVNSSTSAGKIRLAIANPQQIDNTGAVSSSPGAPDPTGTRTLGQIGSIWSPIGPIQKGNFFITRNVSNY